MVDRGLSIAGLGLAVIFGLAPFFIHEMSPFVYLSGIAIGIFLLGLSLGHVLIRKKEAIPSPVSRACLRIRSYGDTRLTEGICLENIYRWYTLKTQMSPVGVQGAPVLTIQTLFVGFANDVLVSNLRVSSPDMPLPQHEVKEFNPRFAIIVFMGDFQAGTIEVSVVPS